MKPILTTLLILLPMLSAAGRPTSELPMYGGQHDPVVQQNTQFSKDAAQAAWRHYYKGEFDIAIKRFNQAWMFDRDNPEVYWGFGLIMGQRASIEDTEENLKQSIRFLEMAVAKAPENGMILGDLAFSHTLLGHYYQSHAGNSDKAPEQFNIAGSLFEKAYEIEPAYPPITANWAVLHFYLEKFDLANEKVKKAQKLGYRFSREFLSDLRASSRARSRR
jgi:tetratricopeptide (TPR) repeat protein